MRRLLLPFAVVAAVACSPRRTVELDFTADKTSDLDSIKKVEIEVWDTAKCRCVDLDKKSGCDPAHVVSRSSFGVGVDSRTIESLPSGPITVRVRAEDAQGMAITAPLIVDCWCAADRDAQTLVFSLGGPTSTYDPAGRGCPP